MEKINFDDIKQMTTECLNKLFESTNMKALYHFTSIYSLREIARNDELLAANYLKDYWDDSSHISLTRHKSNLEGFASTSKKNKNVRIQFNIDKLNSRHVVRTIKPMEFYSPNRHGKYTITDFGTPPNASSKAYYHSPKNWDTDEKGIEYHNQAEEGLQMQYQLHRPSLKNLHKYIDRIDILFDDYLEAIKDYKGWNNVLSEYDEISDTAFAKYVPIFVYTDENHFVLQDRYCMRLKDMVDDFNENYGNIKDIHSKRFDEFLGSVSNLEESELNEHTNMKALYHFTTLTRFASIAGTNRLTAANYNNRYWDNNDHISLTRHKGDLEGFANASFSKDYSIARIELNTEKLNSRHDVLNIKAMDFYSPKRERFDAVNGRGIEAGKSGKERYQDKDYYYKRQELGGNNAIRGQWNRFARLEYQNQAEEGLQVQKHSDIKTISNYVNRVDIFYPNFQEMAMGFKNYQNDLKSFSYILRTEFGKKVPIYVYDDRKHFILQDDNCKELKEIVEMFKPMENKNKKLFIEKDFIMEKLILTESDLHTMVTEAARRILKEIGDTPKGQYMLGRLDGRYMKKMHGAKDERERENMYRKATEINNYASEKTLNPERYSDDEEDMFSLPNAYELGYRDELGGTTASDELLDYFGYENRLNNPEKENEFRKKYLGGVSKS